MAGTEELQKMMDIGLSKAKYVMLSISPPESGLTLMRSGKRKTEYCSCVKGIAPVSYTRTFLRK